jgi:hypothetical protein
MGIAMALTPRIERSESSDEPGSKVVLARSAHARSNMAATAVLRVHPVSANNRPNLSIVQDVATCPRRFKLARDRSHPLNLAMCKCRQSWK